jgi:hypothetical protein
MSFAKFPLPGDDVPLSGTPDGRATGVRLVRSLRPNVNQEDAVRMFRSGGVLGKVRSLGTGPLRSIAPAYLPIFLYEVEIENRGTQQISVMGIDSVSGTLDPYHFEHVLHDSELVTCETRNYLMPAISTSQAEPLLIAKVRRHLYGRGFFRLANIAITARFLQNEIHIPYWLGFYGSGDSVRISVIDAVRRTREGAKARHVFESWLARKGPQSSPEQS